MFGDIAHGTILFCFGTFLCFYGDTIKSGPLKLIVPHRYLFTLMGFFATYCGFIYNDFLSISLNLFGSCYDPNVVAEKQEIPRHGTECVYGLGVDPVWAVASNELNYVNSLKMKISVIIAVVHMTLGVFVKGGNSLYFKRWVEFIFEFIPQLIFMVGLFGYMDFLIVFKWLKPWDSHTIPASPSIITLMINLPLRLGKTQDCCGGQPLWGTPDNTSQNQIQLILLLVALLCVPLMLLVKPIYEICCKDHSKPGFNRVSSGESKKLIESS